MSVCMFMVSNALLISSTMAMVRSGGVFWLKPVAIVWLMLCSAVSVEWLRLYPCCVAMSGMLSVMNGKSVFSNVLASVESSEIGLYEVPMLLSLLGFGIGMMLASFHV